MSAISATYYETTAFKSLVKQGIKATVPKFSKEHLKSASALQVSLEIPVVEMEPRSEDGNGVSLLTLAAVGHMSSRASWRCQHVDGEPSVMVHDGFCDYRAQNPRAEDVLHITGVSQRLGDGKHTLRFLVHTFHGEEKVIIAQGNSILSEPPIPAFSDVSIGQLAPPTPATPAQPTPPATQASSPTSSPAPLPLLRRKSSLHSAPYTLPKKRVSFGPNEEQKLFQFMLLNVTTQDPDAFKELREVLDTIGVKAIKMFHVPLPIQTSHKHLFYFEVYDEDSAKVESVIEEENWAEVFKPETMATTRKGNMAKAMSMQDIVEAMILSTMVATGTGEDPSGIPLRSNVLEVIANKEHIKKAMQRKGVVERVTEQLSNRGMDILLRLLDSQKKT
ncbi:hypothetical protein CAEBREN_21856 [Caenorhabditis brenneri]|uniref:Uncharacterized protein n=1 Tax=Caenorhabditis brenneri TaxID=135651 RepID=G0N2B8_CAEBE|nr:hypothetical protein CAEBREN_21856 [Caenorhabditis brenneri]